MSFDTVFKMTSTMALVGWSILVLLPRSPVLLRCVRYGLIGLLSLVYAVLAMVYFFRVEGGGFGSIAQLRALFMSDPVLVAGWVHYLAFDLFVGLWIAERADEAGVSRLLQAPILVMTFMFGPLGLVAYYLTRSAPVLVAPLTPSINR